ncbi:MAG: hypothetical protein LBC09_04660 [Helicobacteraceae bacterium]|jgi:hypothetical protein|nr:hypothetical protein [Helicobacteraceae bacterium]
MEINPIRAGAAPYTSAPARAATAQAGAVSELSLTQTNIKAQSASLKNDNDLFGAIKTLERSLGALKTTALAAKNGEIDRGEAAKIIADRVENTRYKNENLYENFPLKGANATNARERLNFGDNDAFIAAIDDLIKANADALSEVKSRLLGETKKLGDLAQKSYEQSGLNLINPSGIVASTNTEYLKTQFAALTR